MKKQKEKVKLKILKEVDVCGYSLWAFLGDLPEYWYDEPFVFNGKEYHDIEEFEQDYPHLVQEQPHSYKFRKTIVLKINLDDGSVSNWPVGVACDFHDLKIVDSGYYMIMDDELDPIVMLDDYVPTCLGKGGYGDYLEFEINDKGYIVDWKFNQSLFDEMVKSAKQNE